MLKKKQTELIQKLMDEGRVTKKTTRPELRTIFHESFGYTPVTVENADTLETARYAKEHSDWNSFLSVCAQLVHEAYHWPDNDAKNKSAIRQKKVKEIAPEQLPFLQKIKSRGLMSDYQRLEKQRTMEYLTPQFFWEAAQEYRRNLGFSPSKSFWDELSQALRSFPVSGSVAAQAKLKQRFRKKGPKRNSVMCNNILDAIYCVGLPAELQKEFETEDCCRFAFELYRRGIAPLDFVRNYSEEIDHTWFQLEKITPNPLWDRLPDKKQATALYKGMKPVELARNYHRPYDRQYTSVKLTKSEADLWIKWCAGEFNDEFEVKGWTVQGCLGANLGAPMIFLAWRLGLSLEEYARFRGASRLLLEWYARKKDLPSMNKVRTMHGPGGQQRTYRFCDLLDEISEADLGPAEASLGAKLAASPEKVFEAAARRRQELYLASIGSSVELPALQGVTDPPEGISQIRNSADLQYEGKDLHHCVGGYVNHCLNGISHIFSIRTPHGRSTAEICPTDRFPLQMVEKCGIGPSGLVLVQHRGPYNEMPARENIQLLLTWCEENGITTSQVAGHPHELLAA